jgi:hypothetical protein
MSELDQGVPQGPEPERSVTPSLLDRARSSAARVCHAGCRMTVQALRSTVRAATALTAAGYRVALDAARTGYRLFRNFVSLAREIWSASSSAVADLKQAATRSLDHLADLMHTDSAFLLIKLPVGFSMVWMAFFHVTPEELILRLIEFNTGEPLLLMATMYLAIAVTIHLFHGMHMMLRMPPRSRYYIGLLALGSLACAIAVKIAL